MSTARIPDGTPRYVLEDPGLPHQIVIKMSGQDIAVSCNCLCRNRAGYALETRSSWSARQAYGRWQQHMAEVTLAAQWAAAGERER